MMKEICLNLLVLLFIINVAFSENICQSPKNPCKCVLHDNKVIDLSSVGLQGRPRFSELLFDPNCSEVYSYNPCYPFISPDKYTTTDPKYEPCAGASACVKGFGGDDGNPPEEHAIGIQSTAIFGQIKDQYYINYTFPGSSKILQVNLKCDNESADKLTMDELQCSNSTDTKEIVLTLTSKCACLNACQKSSPEDPPSGLSTGSKLLIAFFTILLAYLIIGIVWNYCNGSKGMELVPNIEFWNDLPTLIMEGVVFTCSCCGRQSSYGEV